jgi:azurin
LEAIIALSHYQSSDVVEALLETTELPTDDYIDYALEESLKHLKPVWMEIFQKNKNFLADEPEKANRLLQSLASKEALDLPGFLKGDPQFNSFFYKSLSKKDYRALSGVTAVERFRKRLERKTTEFEKVEDPENSELDQDKVIRLASMPGKMLFDKKIITITAGESISLIFDNPDQMPHNVVITKPGSMEKVGNAADKMGSLADGYARNFVPDMPDVLFASPLVGSGKSFTLKIKAPDVPGEYPFICTFPGHWRMMKGIIRVTEAIATKN